MGGGIYVDNCIEFFNKENYLIQQMNLMHMSGRLFSDNKNVKTRNINVFFTVSEMPIKSYKKNTQILHILIFIATFSRSQYVISVFTITRLHKACIRLRAMSLDPLRAKHDSTLIHFNEFLLHVKFVSWQ